MNKFKEGDRVKILSTGEEGVVRTVIYVTPIRYCVKLDNFGGSFSRHDIVDEEDLGLLSRNEDPTDIIMEKLNSIEDRLNHIEKKLATQAINEMLQFQHPKPVT